MDFTTIANLLLFSGAIGATYMLDSGRTNSSDAPEGDAHSDDDAQARIDQGSETDDAVAADRDMLAWFLNGGGDTFASASGVQSAQAGAGDGEGSAGADDEILPVQAGEAAVAEDQPGGEIAADAAADPWADSDPFHITDFAGGDDSIEILYAPHFDAQTNLEIPPTLEVQDTADGASAIILLDGVAVAQVDGAAGLDASRVVLTADHDPGQEPAPSGTDDASADDEGDDVLHGSADDDEILGGAGADGQDGGDAADPLAGFERGAAGDGTMSGIDGADTLFGSEGDDTLVSGHDTFEIDEHWDSEGEIARITDFVGGSDVLELHYTPTFDSTGIEIPPLVTLVPMTGSTMIVVDAQPVALLDGNLDVRLSDIALIAA